MIPLETCKFEDSSYTDGDMNWTAPSLYAAAKKQGCRKFKLPLDHLDLTWRRWKDLRVIDMAYFYQRIRRTNLNHPILLGPCGNILDGAHRIVRAIAEGKNYVWAVRLRDMPVEDGKA